MALRCNHAFLKTFATGGWKSFRQNLCQLHPGENLFRVRFTRENNSGGGRLLFPSTPARDVALGWVGGQSIDRPHTQRGRVGGRVGDCESPTFLMGCT
jgi:hypothetical protein